VNKKMSNQQVTVRTAATVAAGAVVGQVAPAVVDFVGEVFNFAANRAGRGAPPTPPRTPNKNKRSKTAQGGRVTPAGSYYTPGLGLYSLSKMMRPSHDFLKCLKMGVHYTKDTTYSVNDYQCLYIGHTTMPLYRITVEFCRALIKALLFKDGYIIPSFDDTVPAKYINANLAVEYYNNASDTSLTASGVTFGSGTLWDTYCNNFAQQLIGINSGSGQVAWWSFYLNMSTDFSGDLQRISEIRADTLRIHYTIADTMMIQNRTPADTAESTGVPDTLEYTNITNAPIHGKRYFGYGHMMGLKGRRDWLVRSSQNDGWMVPTSKTGSGSTFPYIGIGDPPDVAELTQVIGSSAETVPAGSILTSYLAEKKVMTFESLMALMKGTSYSTASSPAYTSDPRVKLGHFNVFAFCNAMNAGFSSAGSGSSSNLVVLQINRRYSIHTCIRYATPFVTNPKVDVANAFY